ncbi:NADH dehydrogenase subunit [Natronococcus wangiae]|uniref:NADH dehydrogenase subunit n=1 Tax=Natronococcus wangiae TaxID=3068275 RepID=UPI00273FCFD8|nr:NADH dehydrogenase subunit [Natronococcus sp. AD5]
MAVTQDKLEGIELPEFAVTLQNAGVAGAGGAGFPAYAKWKHLDRVHSLLVNHQESEPNYYIDKWLGREHAEMFATLFDALLDRAFDRIVIGAKAKDREEWMLDLERETGGVVYTSDELPIDEDASGIIFAYTEDRYEYGMENVLLRLVADEVIGTDLPVDHGWIVQNTETMYNVYRALENGEPTISKYIHVDGAVPAHRFLKVPVGTPAADLLAAAGRESDLNDEVLLDGGPGWCFEAHTSPAEFGVRKRTNCVLVMDVDIVDANRLGGDRISVLDPHDWSDENHEIEPTATLSPDRVLVPRITNPAFEGVVTPSEPIVEPGATVRAGEMIARPGDGISIAQHASIDGEVTAVTDQHIVIKRRNDPGARGNKIE